jgi:hypothetical protein
MSYVQLLESIIQKQKVKKVPKRVIGNAIFKMIVEMAYEMKYANRYCEAERTNRFEGVPTDWNVKLELKGKLPFETEDKYCESVRLGDIVIVPHFPRGYKKWVMSRVAKVIRINQKSISLADCNQDGQLIEYNPDEDCDYPTKQHRKDYNKVFVHYMGVDIKNHISIIKGTKHLRYDGWDS